MIIAVDTGGTKTLVAVFSTSGALLSSVRFPTPKKPADYIEMLVRTIHELHNGPITALSVAMPGIIKQGVAVWCNNLHWKNFDVERALAKQFPQVPLFIENDANLGGLAEARALSPTPPSVLYATISTGIGTGIITGGDINQGMRLSEGGRLLVEYDGVVREWESFASGKAIHNAYGKYARDITSKRAWRQIADRISRGFLALIPVIQPDVIVIGGSMGTFFAQYGQQLELLLKEALPDHIPCPKIVAATHPEEAVIYGCYLYASDQRASR